MKYLILILIVVSMKLYANPTDSIKSFDLTIDEVYGCYSWEPYYVNYHYENNKFCITYSGADEPLKKEYFNKKEFMNFYDSLLIFNYHNLKNYYKVKKYGSASHPGQLLISINNKLKFRTN